MIPNSIKQGLPKRIVKKAISYKYADLCLSSYELQATSERVWKLDDRSTELEYGYPSRIAPYRNDDSIYTKSNPDFIFRQPFISEIKGGYIVGPRAAVVTANNQIAADSLTRPTRHNQIHAHLGSTVLSPSYLKSKLEISKIKPGSKYDTVAILHRKSSVNNFYHWVVERLLTLRGISKYQSITNSEVTILVTPDAPQFVFEIITRAGFDPEQIEHYYGGPVLADTIVLPSWPELTATTMKWLRDTVIESIQPNSTGDDYLYISRQRTDRRRVANFDEIEPILDQYGFKQIFLEDLSLEEEINYIRSARGVVSPHGAGLTSMIWADDLSILEIFNGVIIPPFYLMADLLGHQYDAILGHPAETNNKNRHRNIQLDPTEFENRLSSFVS